MVWPQLQEGNRDAYLYPSFELVPITVHDRHNNVVWPQLLEGKPVRRQLERSPRPVENRSTNAK